MKRSKLGANAVNSSKVLNGSLTGSDIDESTLSLPAPPTTLPPSGAAGGDLTGTYPNPELGSGVVGEAEAADRERRVVITPAEMLHSSAGGPGVNFNDNPEVFATLSHQAAEFAHAENNALAALTEVPLDRAPGTPMEVRLLWSTVGTTGEVVWRVGFNQMTVGQVRTSYPDGPKVVVSSPGTDVVAATPVVEIPAGAVTNGEPLALRVVRDGTDGSDTLIQQARCHLLEIRYTATG